MVIPIASKLVVDDMNGNTGVHAIHCRRLMRAAHDDKRTCTAFLRASNEVDLVPTTRTFDSELQST
jgi:hypothetical protein